MLPINQFICVCVASAITLAAGNTNNILPGSPVVVNQNAIVFPIKKERPVQNFIEPVVVSDTPTTVIPFSRAGNLIVIKAKVGSTDRVFTVHLSTGKHLYKFIVDGKWIHDPANKLWEQNEHNSGNSVIWFEAH